MVMEWQEFTETSNKAEVLRQVEAMGYAITQRTFYRHCGQGKCRTNNDGVYSRRLVKQYIETEGILRTGEPVAEQNGPDVALAVAKQQGEVEKLRIDNERASLKLQKERGELIEREAVYLELAARGVVLSNSFENDIVDERSRELIVAVGGDLGRIHEFQDLLRGYWVDLINSYCTTDIEVFFADQAGGDE